MTASSTLLVSSSDTLTRQLESLLTVHGHLVCSLPFDQAEPVHLDLSETAVVLLALAAGTPGGLAWCRELRTHHPDAACCVLFEAAAPCEVAGALELGADAAFCQPINEMVLQAQLLALARRYQDTAPPIAPCNVQLAVDLPARDATMDGRPLPLTTAEFDLLALLARNAGIVLTRDTISQELRGFPHRDQDRSIDLRVHQVRRKLGDDARHPRIIKSVRGLGYLLAVKPRVRYGTDT